MSKRLNQVLAIEKGVKTRVYGEITEWHKTTQKADLFEGFADQYLPRDENGESLPPRSKRVQVYADAVFDQISKSMTELFDIVATKDWANCSAKADVVVDGKALLKDVPSTYLLFLDKQLSDLVKFLSAFSELDPTYDWAKDTQSGGWRTSPVKNQRTEKVQRAIVLYAATIEHPAQTQLITEDQVVGYWEKVRFSGALPRTEKQKLLDRTHKLMHAVKEALERANLTEVVEQNIGGTVFGYLFGA